MKTEQTKTTQCLLSEVERSRIIERVRKQKFLTTRKNVLPWCMQWITLAFGVLSLPEFIGHTTFGIKQTLLLALPWFLAALIYHESWERYKEQSILRECLDTLQKIPSSVIPDCPPTGELGEGSDLP